MLPWLRQKKSYWGLYKIEGLGFFMYYWCAQHKNIYQPGDICHCFFFTGICGLSPSKTKSWSNSMCEKKYYEHLLLHLCNSCWLLPCRTAPCQLRARRAGWVGSSPWSAQLCWVQHSLRLQQRIWPAASLEYGSAALIIASWKDTIYFCHVCSVLAFCLLPFYSQKPWL